MRTMLKSKIHRARVTGLNIDYEGSITIDKKLMVEADILPYEQVQVLNLNNGARFTTYAIEGTRDSGRVCLNGASARLAQKSDIILILAYCQVEDSEAHNFLPRLVYVDAKNRIVEIRRAIENIPF
ncbi:MAG: aspartate 1-decarboxylase [Dehalococcoidales bacterium]|nr:aspartate 1-decarboxylase [Dehalococcoidales bacterium]